MYQTLATAKATFTLTAVVVTVYVIIYYSKVHRCNIMFYDDMFILNALCS